MVLCKEEPPTEASSNDHVPTVGQVPMQQHSSAGPYPGYKSDPLAADNPGEELLPEASVWKIYKKEATEHDNELVKGRHENLDTMLLFAALFSTILTAFLVESTSLLQEDPAKMSADLLLVLARSQLGVANVSSTSLDSPPFTPTSAARWVNGLWFSALALSLAAAMLAMLAKEWLDAFATSHKRAPHAFAITRQARLDGFEDWHAPQIMDLLPTLLHISLLLFSLGLVVYLQHLDKKIALMISAIIALTFLFYVGTIYCGAVYDHCPFVTRISKYLQAAIHFIVKKWAGKLNTRKFGNHENMAIADVRALSWLGRNARDQESIDSAYQALAGLRNRRMKESVTTAKIRRNLKQGTNERQFVVRFFRDFGAWFDSALTESPQEIAKCHGENLIRYLRALPEIMDCMATYMTDHYNERGKKTWSCAFKRLGDTVNCALRSTSLALDKVWNSENGLSALTYTYAATAEMRYIQAIVTAKMHVRAQSGLPSSGTTIPNSHSVPIHQAPQAPLLRLIEIDPADLWTRYEASLFCATCLLERYFLQRDPSQGEATVNIQPSCLMDLLDTIKTSATSMLGLASPYSQSSRNKNTNFFLNFWGLPTSSRLVFATALVKLLEVTADPNSVLKLTMPRTGMIAKARTASACAMYAIARLYIVDWASMNQTDPENQELHDCETDTSAEKGVRVVLFAAKHRPSLNIRSGVLVSSQELLEFAMKALLRIIEFTPEQDISESWLDQLLQSVETARGSLRPWPAIASQCLIRILSGEFGSGDPVPRTYKTVWSNKFNFQQWCSLPNRRLSLQPFPLLLRLIQNTPGCVPEVQLLLDEVMKQFEDSINPNTERLLTSHTLDNPFVTYFRGWGFSELAAIAEHEDYSKHVARAVVRLCKSVHFHQNKRPISNTSRSGFLAAVFVALKHNQTITHYTPPRNFGFVEGVMKLLNASLRASKIRLQEANNGQAVKMVHKMYQLGEAGLGEDVGNILPRYIELPKQSDQEILILKNET